MRIGIVAMDGFNEIDVFVAVNILNRAEFEVSILADNPQISSMHGQKIVGCLPLERTQIMHGVLLSSGSKTSEFIEDPVWCSQISLDPAKQWIGAQCSGVLILEKFGLLPKMFTLDRQSQNQIAVESLNQPFVAVGQVATAGGCLSSTILAAWFIKNLLGPEKAKQALLRVVPVGQEKECIDSVFDFLD